MAGMLKRFGGAAGVLLAAFSLFAASAHAAPPITCSGGQVYEFTVTSIRQVGTFGAETCSVGDKMSSESQTISECRRTGQYQSSSIRWAEDSSPPITYSGSGTTRQWTTLQYARYNSNNTVYTNVGNNAYGTVTCVTPIPNPCAAKTDDEVITSGTGSLPTNWGQACIDNCAAMMDTSVEVGSGWGAVGKYTGSSCSSGSVAEKTPITLPDQTPGYCVGDSCLSLSKKNCGYVNNEYRCITSTQLTTENPCADTASGGKFCKDGAATPPVPNNGTPGQPALADSQFKLQPTRTGSFQQNSVLINYYNSNTVNGDSEDPGDDDGGDDGDENGNGICDEGETCTVKIDETGTPNGLIDLPDQTGTFDSFYQDALDNGMPSAGPDLTAAHNALPIPQAAACMKIETSFDVPIYGTVHIEFPNDIGCLWIERWKAAVGFFLYLLTALTCIHMVLRDTSAPKG